MIVEIQNLELKFKVKSKDPIVISLQNSTKNQSSCLILFSELKPTWFLKGNLGMVLIDIKNISKINQEDWIPQLLWTHLRVIVSSTTRRPFSWIAVKEQSREFFYRQKLRFGEAFMSRASPLQKSGFLCTFGISTMISF